MFSSQFSVAYTSFVTATSKQYQMYCSSSTWR